DPPRPRHPRRPGPPRPRRAAPRRPLGRGHGPAGAGRPLAAPASRRRASTPARWVGTRDTEPGDLRDREDRVLLRPALTVVLADLPLGPAARGAGRGGGRVGRVLTLDPEPLG